MVWGQNKNNVGAYYKNATECMPSELDGSITLKVWGTGRNLMDATEQAKKNAVSETLFKGFIDCQVKALVLEVNAEEKYQYFFNAFFKDNGKYLDFISMEDTRPFNRIKSRERKSEEVKYGFVVRVLRPELREYLINEKILKP